MRAMILAAGKGSRLKPITDKIPKALVPIAGRPLLVWAAEKLIAAGVNSIVVNVHHHAGQLKHFISELDYPGIEFKVSDESGSLLDTGGAIMHAKHLLDNREPFYVYNADVVSDIDLRAMFNTHKRSGALVTLAVTSRKSSRYFLWQNGQLCGWKNELTGQSIITRNNAFTDCIPMAFSGIHIIDPKIFTLTAKTGSFPINELYLELAASEHIAPFAHSKQFWADTGTPEKLMQAEKMLRNNRMKFI